MNKTIFSILCCLLLFPACAVKEKEELKVAATAVPHAQILEHISPELKKQGINLKIIVIDDYNMPNRALASHEIDANFFQHIPFLDEQIKQFDYQIQNFGAIEIEPMGIYSKKIRLMSDLQDASTIAIPNDPTNEARALLLLQNNGVIQLDNSNNLQATILNITNNPKHIHFIEVDAAMLPRSLEDVDLAIINTNYALLANLNPLQDAIAIEDKNSPYANVVVIRKGEENRSDLQALKKALTSKETKAFISETYHGAVLSAVKE